jgi:undecaprenyl diphosphate synthase
MSETNIPKAVGFILDGNRRWARENGLPTLEGHRRGMGKVKEIVEWAHEAGIADVIVYAFSTENWNRSEEEVAYLMDLFEEFCGLWTEDLKKQGGRVCFIGQRERFRKTLQEKLVRAEEETKHGTNGTLFVCLSYGGRAEILAGVNSLLKGGVTEATEETLRSAMWSAKMPDPDIIIRTGGEKRLSGFLTWQSVYSELFFTDTKLPAFTKEEFLGIVKEFGERQRRHGR